MGQKRELNQCSLMIRGAMKAKGLTHNQMIKRLGCSPSALFRWIGKGHIPTVYWLLRLSTFCRLNGLPDHWHFFDELRYERGSGCDGVTHEIRYWEAVLGDAIAMRHEGDSESSDELLGILLTDLGRY